MLFHLASGKMPRTKHGLSFLNSFQICRPKTPCSMIKSPLPALTYMCSSPRSNSTFDISLPTFPDPPPPTPSKAAPIHDHFASHAYAKPRKEERLRPEYKETDWQAAPPLRTNKKKNRMGSVSSGDSDETESLFSSQDSSHPPKTEGQVRQKSRRAQRFKRYGSKEWKCHEKKPVSEGVEESFVVVKRSVDPYEDFKKSMSEMILEKQMFDPKELEQLLMNFLSLNSRLHHKVIVEAFAEVLEQVFCG